ncbi:MAG TPA: hypothetical protein VL866_24500 [Pyrinomonadaceae bacterium]|nr:hypothetical protein [Pyrinomonadaceae bacterium]
MSDSTKEAETRQFSLRAVLTVTSGRLITEIGEIYQILNWITGDEIFTHQIPRAIGSAAPWLLKCFPELAPASVNLESLDRWIKSDHTGGHEGIRMWITELKMMFPDLKDHYDIVPLSEGWISMDPRIEAETIVGDRRKVITVERRHDV